jgi:hypothetical protein
MVYHGLPLKFIDHHFSTFFLWYKHMHMNIYTHVLKCIPFKGVKCVNYIHIHTRYMFLTQLNHCFDGQCAPCPLSWPGSRPYQGGGSVWDNFEVISCDIPLKWIVVTVYKTISQ